MPSGSRDGKHRVRFAQLRKAVPHRAMSRPSAAATSAISLCHAQEFVQWRVRGVHRAGGS